MTKIYQKITKVFLSVVFLFLLRDNFITTLINNPPVSSASTAGV